MSSPIHAEAELNPKLASENEALRRLMSETILNIQGLVEDAELVLRRARQQLESLSSEGIRPIS
jgi:hypothetical protein